MMEKQKQQKASPKAVDPRTLFVKFHPPSAVITRQHLSDHFSNYGPINRASVIRQTKSKGQSQELDDDGNEKPNLDRGTRGFGFVRFVHEDDAKAAADAIAKKSSGKKSGEVMIVDGVKYKLHAERAVDAAAAASASKKETDEGPKEDTSATDATQAKMDPATYKAEAKRKRTSRVIIRNLSFYANEKHIKSTMESTFGPVVEVNLPLVPSLPNEAQNSKKSNVPRHRGFAFVTFSSAASAKKAVEQGSEVKIKNRLVAIDFSVSKQEHQKMMKEAEKKEDSDSDSSSSDSEEEDGDENDGAGSNEDSDSESSASESEEDSDSEDDSIDEESDEEDETKVTKGTAKAPKFDANEAQRTLFLRNIPFDATRHDLFELFREFGRIQAVYLVKDPKSGVFKGTAFVRYEKEEGATAALEASGGSNTDQNDSTFVSSKNIAVGLGGDAMNSLSLKGRPILVDLAVDRTTASSLAVQRDEDGKPIKKMIGKDRRNLYLKNEGRVSSSADSASATSAGAKHGGIWEDLPPSDRAKRERAFADKSTKLRSPLFFINPTRISIRNLGKHVNESALKKLAFRALQAGLEQKLVTPKDAVAHWRAGGDLPQSEVMRRATDMNLVLPPVDKKNVKLSIPSVFIDRAVADGQKAVDAPSKGFGFVEFTHHAHALAALRQLNNNPAYSAEYAAGGKKAAEMQKRGKKGKNDGKEGSEFLGEDGKVYLPRLIVEFAVENKVKARQQAEKVAQKEANKIKQRIEKRGKESDKEKKKTKKGRGSLQRERKRARKEEEKNNEKNATGEITTKSENSVPETKPSKKQKMMKPPKKQKRNRDNLEDMINEYKSSFTKTNVIDKKTKTDNEYDRSSVAKKRWFE